VVKNSKVLKCIKRKKNITNYNLTPNFYVFCNSFPENFENCGKYKKFKICFSIIDYDFFVDFWSKLVEMLLFRLKLHDLSLNQIP